MFRGDVTRSGSTVSNGGSKLTLAWTYCTGAPVSASPVVHNGMVYIGSLAHTLTALDIRTGKKVWQIQASDAFYSTPVIENGIVYAAALNELFAIDAKSGRVYWHAQVETAGGKFWSSPVILQGMVIIGLASNLSERPKVAGRILALDARTGTVRWRTYILANSAPGGGVWSSPAIDETRGVVYVATGDPDDGVQALSLHDGHVLWHWRSVTKDVSDTDIGAGPLLYRDRAGKLHVVVGGKDGTIYNLDAVSGQVIWRIHIAEQIFSSPAFSDGILYVVGTFQNRHALSIALDAQTGTIRWKYAIATMIYASPVVDGQILYQPTGNGFGFGDAGVEVINATNGQRIQYMDLHSPSNSSPAILPSWLFVGASNGNLCAFTRSAQR
jgi:outer membrane protein assembly factor BamB